MYAILESGGKQYRVQPGDTINVERLPAEPGQTLDLGAVLLVAGAGERARVGAPSVPGAIVRAEVLDHARGEKVVVFRYKSKVRYRRKTGHRQALTRLRITDILLDGRSTAAAATTTPAAAEPAAAEPAAAPTASRRRAARTEQPVSEPAAEPEAAPEAPTPAPAEPSTEAEE